MARGTTLVKLLTDLRAEVSASPNPAHNVQVRDRDINLLQRTQERLWEDFAWPHLRVERDIQVQAGQRFYEPPEDIGIDQIESLQVFDSQVWEPICAGIGAPEYAAFNSQLDQRSWPPRRWRIFESERIELWPVPDQNADLATMSGYLRVTGIRFLKPLVADGDRADLDDRLLTLYAAAEILAKTGAKDAQLKLDGANAHYAKLRAGLTPQRRFRMFGTGQHQVSRRLVARYTPVR